jgi:hypothetical protein
MLDEPSENRVVPCARTDITKLIVAFRNSANVPNNAGGDIRYQESPYTVFDYYEGAKV